MITFYFMRHAESEANTKDILASQIDFSLSKRGIEDIAKIANEFFRITSIDRIISSPLKRALQTASPFSILFNLEIEQDASLIEQNLGIYSGLTYEETKREKGYEHDKTKRWNWLPQNGESYEMIAERVKPFFERFKNLENDSNILVVTHAVTLRLIKGLLENTLPVYPEELAKNGEIWKVKFQGIGYHHTIESIFIDKEKIRVHGE